MNGATTRNSTRSHSTAFRITRTRPTLAIHEQLPRKTPETSSRPVGNTHGQTQTSISRPAYQKEEGKEPSTTRSVTRSSSNEDSCDIISTLSPVDRPSAWTVDCDEGDEMRMLSNPFCTTTLFERGSMPPSALSAAASPKRRRRLKVL